MQLSSREASGELRRRALIAMLIVASAFVALWAQLYFLQIDQGSLWRSRSENNRIRLRRIAPIRGLILDSNREPLVDNRPSFDVVVVPEDTPDLMATVRRVSEFLGTEVPSLKEIKAATRHRPPYEGMIIQRDVGWDAVVALESRQLELPGVLLEIGPRRSYPYGSLAAHVLGYVGEASRRELDADDSYHMGDLLGKSGSERAFEEALRGLPGGQQIEVDSLGRRLRVLSEVPSGQGNNLVLSVDRRLQQFTEQLMAQHDGAAVVLRPSTGEILAMVSRPAFDPNVFARRIGHKEWRELTEAKSRPLHNRAIEGQYPPGSTFKIVTAAAALEEGVVTPFTRIRCGGSWYFGGRSYRCWRRGGHGSVNLHEALVQSCDVYFYQVGHRLGVDTIAEYANRLGLGHPTGVQLQNEKPGLIPTSEWKKKRFKEPWFAGETLSVSIGQGYVLATPLQMANLAATIANGGTVHKPRFVNHVETPEGEIDEQFEPEIAGEAGLRKTTLHQIREALRDVVNSPGGTGKAARLPTVAVAGKTGTSQVARLGASGGGRTGAPKHLRDHAWFVAFAPVDEPEIAIAVLVEHAGGGGGKMAAPIARDIADFYFALTRGRAYQLAGDIKPPSNVIAALAR